jgi:SAM-dependent methyltransferase
MTFEDAERFFDAIAGRYDRAYGPSASESRERMARVIRELPTLPARVLDLGVGTGRELAALLDAGYEPTGVDVSNAMLEKCARRARPVPLVRADFWRAPLPFGDDSFHASLALHGTLAHPPDAEAVARLGRELGRVVRAGGTFIAEVPSPAWLDRLETQPAPGDRRIRRTGLRTCVVEDLAAGASIEARLLDEAEWRAALGPPWQPPRIEAIDAVEWLVVARRV